MKTPQIADLAGGRPRIGAHWEAPRRVSMDDDDMRMQAMLLHAREAQHTPKWEWVLYALTVVGTVLFFVLRSH